MLAAESPGYPQSYALQSFGGTGILTKCLEASVTFSAENFTGCGHEPVTGNFTKGLNGKTLVPKSRCVWKNSFANFDGIVHEFFISSWRSVIASYNAQTAHTRAIFPRTIDTNDRFLAFSCLNLLQR